MGSSLFVLLSRTQRCNRLSKQRLYGGDKIFFSLESFMFNRLRSLLYYNGEHADSGPIRRIDIGRNQTVMLLIEHAGRVVILYRGRNAFNRPCGSCSRIIPRRVGG